MPPVPLRAGRSLGPCTPFHTAQASPTPTSLCPGTLEFLFRAEGDKSWTPSLSQHFMMLSVHHAKTEKNPEKQTVHLLRLHLRAVGPRLSAAGEVKDERGTGTVLYGRATRGPRFLSLPVYTYLVQRADKQGLSHGAHLHFGPRGPSVL